MAPQPVHQDNVIGGLRPASQPVRKTSQGELDEERKQELIMEKKLRACRVSILPKVSIVLILCVFLTLYIYRVQVTLSSQRKCSPLLQRSLPHRQYQWRR